MILPSVSSPTGTEIGAPVLSTAWPLLSPSVVSIAIVLTEFSPRCWATSRTNFFPSCSTSKASNIAGRWSSNFTSTTAPMT